MGILVSLGVFSFIRMFAKGTPGTMNKEYQEATNEYLKVFPLFLLPLMLLCLISSLVVSANNRGK